MRAAPGKLLELIELLKKDMARHADYGLERPVLRRHSQGDQWDLLMVIPVGAIERYYQRENMAKRQDSFFLDKPYGDAFYDFVAYHEDLFVSGPDLRDFQQAFEKFNYYHDAGGFAMTTKYLTFHPEVEHAVSKGEPVVALESTIIAHGMPYPQNVETARRVEAIVRSEGAVPATIAILEGKIIVGLDEQELERVAKGGDFLKVSRRDIPLVLAKKLNGATTVAATLFIAARAGIRIFVTGGIGGVHRGAPETLDISADLIELATSDVAVVCAGAKAILDIGLTLEFLETHGVPVVGYTTENFPAFYTRNSGFAVDYSVHSLAEVARALKAKWDLGLSGGMVVANPIPAEHELEPGMISAAIAEALAEAKTKQVRGKETTPFLLSRIEAITGGDSLKANIELVCHNARVGAKLAGELATLQQRNSA